MALSGRPSAARGGVSPRHRQQRRAEPHCRRAVARHALQQQRQDQPQQQQQPQQQEPQPLTLVETQGAGRQARLFVATSSSDDEQQRLPLAAQLFLQQQQQLTSQHRADGAPPLAPPQQQLAAARDWLKALFLPAGWPHSVTEDYLDYQLATVPAHITGWLSISLTTSSLLKAVGINAGPVGATAAAAAIKWIVKDGIGAAGRLLVGGRLGLEFDDDPRRWRMAAEALASIGLALEIATVVYPQHFLLLASTGNFAKALGKGCGKPVFRVIQTHFAASGNVGAVAAKEEVWEVGAQLTGYSLSVLVLQSLQTSAYAGSWQAVVGLWAVVQAAHVTARYNALRQLRFSYLNGKRAKLLVCAHVAGEPLPGVAEGNAREPLFRAASDVAPRAVLGCSLEAAWGAPPAALPPGLLAAWWRLFEGEAHLLVWRDGTAHVVLKDAVAGPADGGSSSNGSSSNGSSSGSGSTAAAQQQAAVQQRQARALLRALWQAAWLDAHRPASAAAAGGQPPDLEPLRASLAALQQNYEGFEAQANELGWRTDVLVLKVGDARVAEAGDAEAGAGPLPAGSEGDGWSDGGL